MAKRSAAIQEIIHSINEILEKKEVYTSVNGDWDYTLSTSSEGKAFKHGLCEALETVLHRTKNYKGFMYIEKNNISDEFLRKYL